MAAKQHGAELGPVGREPKNGLDARRSSEDLGHAVAGALAAQVATGGVVVDERGEILHFYGRTADFIEISPGEPALDLLRMARADLVPRLRRALDAARRTNSDALTPGHVREPGLRVVPVPPADASRPRSFLVLFDEASRDSGVLAAMNGTARPIARRDVLRSLAEDRAAAYEELRSMNEELLTANAELHTMNDELEQSLSELSTLASALRTRNTELARANTALQRAAQEAHAARSRAATIVEMAPIPLVTVDGALAVTCANRAFCDLLKRPHSAVVGAPFLERWIDASAGERLKSALGRAMSAGGWMEDVEFEAELPGMGTRTLLRGGRAIRSEAGDSQLLLALHDTTERKRRLEDEQRALAGRAQRLLNEVGRLLLSEPLGSDQGLAKLARHVVPELGDVCAIDLLDGSDWRRVAFACSRSTRAGEAAGGVDEAELRALIESDRPIVVADLEHDPRFGWLRALGMRFCIGLPLRGRSAVRGALWIGRRVPPRDGGSSDLSVAEGLGQRAGLAMENAQLHAEATAAIEVREEFLGIASHELRTPLFALQLHLEHLNEMLRDETPDLVKGAEKVNRAVIQTRRMGRLVASLLAAPRIMAGKLVLERERVDVGELVTEVVDRMRVEAQRAGCRLDLSVQPDVRGMFDPLRIEQVLANLLTNAFRYASGTQVSIRVHGDPDRVRISVQDRGPGIPKARGAKVFERFETGVQRSAAGLGLGLYVSRQLIEAHGGALELETSDTGASFLATLPREAVVH